MSPVEKDPAAGLNGAVAATFRGERGALGMTFDELSERSGVPVRSLMRFLNAQRHMDVSVVEAIAEALSMTPAEAITYAQARLAKAQPDVVVEDGTGRVRLIEVKGARGDAATVHDLFEEMPRQVQSYVLALATAAPEPGVAEALNEKLAHEHRVDEQWAREARNFMAHIMPAGSGKTESLLNLTILAQNWDSRLERFDLGLTEADRAFLAEIKVGEPLPKAARRAQSLGRGLRRLQDEEAASSQDDPREGERAVSRPGSGDGQ